MQKSKIMDTVHKKQVFQYALCNRKYDIYKHGLPGEFSHNYLSKAMYSHINFQYIDHVAFLRNIRYISNFIGQLFWINENKILENRLAT